MNLPKLLGHSIIPKVPLEENVIKIKLPIGIVLLYYQLSSFNNLFLIRKPSIQLVMASTLPKLFKSKA